MQSLTKVIFKNSKRIDKTKGSGKREKALGALAFSIVFGSLSIAMIIISYIVTNKLIEINQSYAFINILLLMNFLILFGKSVFEGLNVLYFSKDLKILLRMPIKSKDILHAKFLNMIVSEYEMEVIMLAIPMIVYGIITKVSLTFYLYMIGILLIIPVIPILLTSLVISIIMRITNKIKNKSKVMYIAIIITTLVVGIILSGVTSNTNGINKNFDEIVKQTNGIAEQISESYILIKPIMNILSNYNNIQGLQNLIIYILENIAFYILVLFITSQIYMKGAIGTTINSKKNNKNNVESFKLEEFKPKNVNTAYLQKEFKTASRTPIFFIQCILIPIMYPLLIIGTTILLANFADRYINAWDKLYESASKCIGAAMFVSLGQAFYMMNFSSIIAVSRESKNAILTKYIPIALKKQFNLKITIGTLINTLATILVTVLYYLCIHKVLAALLMFISLILINLIGEKFKLLVDLNKPQINWNSEYTMMKQNTNVMYILFYTLIVIGVLIGSSQIINHTEIFLMITIIFTLIINGLIDKNISKNERKIFKKLY